MALLLGGEEYCVCDLMAALKMPQSTVSRHLATLKKAGWLRGRRANKWMYYGLTDSLAPLLQEIMPALTIILAAQEQTALDQERLQRYLASKTTTSCN